MIKDITLGQYFPGNSAIHRLDPRTKLLGMIAYIVIVFLVTKTPVFIIPALFAAICIYLARVPFGYVLRSLKPIRFLLVFMFIVNLFMVRTGKTVIAFWIISITDEAIKQSVYITLRLVLLLVGTSLMTLTTTPIALTDGLERLLMPLSKIHFPAHELAMMMTIALRFIPTLIEEADKIMKAQMARGADFESGNLIKRARNMIPILVPLFVSAFRRADELAMAMESRCYHGGEGRTPYPLRPRGRGGSRSVYCAYRAYRCRAKAYTVKRHTRTMLTLIAVGIIIAAAVWSSIISKNDPLEAVAAELNAHGYSMRGDDLYILGGKADSTIREVLDGSIDAAEAELMVSAAEQAGFAADMDRRGEVSILLYQCEKGVMTIYLIDGEIELCFIQTQSGEVYPI